MEVKEAVKREGVDGGREAGRQEGQGDREAGIQEGQGDREAVDGGREAGIQEGQGDRRRQGDGGWGRNKNRLCILDLTQTLYPTFDPDSVS